MRLLDHPWLFEFGAPIYNWFNAQEIWRGSCAHLVAHFPPVDEPAQKGVASARAFRVLDLGCGPGNSAIEMARVCPNAHIVGLDLASKMLDIARRETQRARLTQNISYVLADAT